MTEFENTDQLIEQMKKDDRTKFVDILTGEYGVDREIRGVKLQSPIEFAKERGMAPQMVYYYIRQGTIEPLECLCGRHVIDAEQANKALKAKQKAQGRKLDTSSDDAR